MLTSFIGPQVWQHSLLLFFSKFFSCCLFIEYSSPLTGWVIAPSAPGWCPTEQTGVTPSGRERKCLCNDVCGLHLRVFWFHSSEHNSSLQTCCVQTGDGVWWFRWPCIVCPELPGGWGCLLYREGILCITQCWWGSCSNNLMKVQLQACNYWSWELHNCNDWLQCNHFINNVISRSII